MRRQDFENSLSRAFTCMRRIELTDWDRLLFQHSLPINREFSKIALRAGVMYPEVYRAGLGLRHYNFILHDFSYFQFSYSYSAGNVTLRYAFFPNPYELQIDDEEIVAAFEEDLAVSELAEVFDQSLDEASLVIGIPPIRYDYDHRGYQPTKHPVSHLHVGTMGGGRWPVRKILSPMVFTLFVAKHYYSIYWNSMDGDAEDEFGYINPLDREFGDFVPRCDKVDDAFFPESDIRHLYLS